MAETERTQSQQTVNPWTKSMQDQMARVEEAYAELAKIQAASIEQACKNVDEAARLTKESFGYATQLSNHWRKLVIDAARRSSEMATPKV